MKTRAVITALAAGTLGTAGVLYNRYVVRRKTLKELEPKPQVYSTYSQVVKPTPTALFRDMGTGSDFETRLAHIGGFITPNNRFYIRSHSPTPNIDVDRWRLVIDGTAVRVRQELTYADLCSMPQVTVTRTMECAGNGRHFFKKAFGKEAQGAQWLTGAIGCAEWTGVRLRDVLRTALLTGGACDVMPEALDTHRFRRPMPIEKALRDDTLLVLKMNGEPLPPDHGFPARVLVSGWTGAASIKWVGRIQVSEKPLYSPYNTLDYVLMGSQYRKRFPVMGSPITEMPVMSVIDLDWPAGFRAGETMIRGRSYAGESAIRKVEYRVDNSDWRTAELVPPSIEGCWLRWQFAWDAQPGEHEIRVRATDRRGRTQPDSVPWNQHGYLYNAVVAHPVSVYC